METTEVLALLKEKQGTRSLRALAADIGVSAAYVSDVYHGNRRPAGKILAYLGLKEIKTVSIVYLKGGPKRHEPKGNR